MQPKSATQHPSTKQKTRLNEIMACAAQLPFSRSPEAAGGFDFISTNNPSHSLSLESLRLASASTYFSSRTFAEFSMASPASLTVPLAVALSPPVLNFSQPAIPIHVAIHNVAATPVTLVNWNTPLDPRAAVLGVFEVSDTNNNPVPLDSIKISRRLPPSTDELVEIPAGQAVETVVHLPSVGLVGGREYTVQAKGIWHAVWSRARDEVSGSQLERFENATRAEFISNEITVDSSTSTCNE
ncbi:uncharacterized protein ATNIH1004_000071 [Aspergillus tanneri]|nr:uncharacterized protein ATNIH1004_000071 [Aspergillus tanneri]KAA8651193.1 hypothetical protein ATNIH1004_000071 [Aspergillus tanneri]